MKTFRLLPLLACLCAAPVLAADIEGVGRELGYRIAGDAKKNASVLLQNSRPGPVEYFDESRGRFVAVPGYGEAEVPCRGKARKLNVRYRDQFRESNPFRIVVECGRDVQFLAPQQIAPPRAAPAFEAPAVEAPAVDAPAETPAAAPVIPEPPSTADPGPAAPAAP